MTKQEAMALINMMRSDIESMQLHLATLRLLIEELIDDDKTV